MHFYASRMWRLNNSASLHLHVLQVELETGLGSLRRLRLVGHAAVLKLSHEVNHDGVLTVDDSQTRTEGLVAALERQSPGAHLRDLLRYTGLALLVEESSERLHQVTGVVGGRFHCSHAGGQLRGLGIEEQ